MEWISVWGTTTSFVTGQTSTSAASSLERFSSIVGYGYEGRTTLADYLSIQTLKDPVGMVLEATGRHIQSLSPEQLILIAKRLSNHLTDKAALPTSSGYWTTCSRHRQPNCSSFRKQWRKAPADLAWALLGHPDKLVRWRAAHLVLDQPKKVGHLRRQSYDKL